MLGVDGPPGVGKTFGIAATLRRARVTRFTLTGADLESPEAGKPAMRVRQAYLAAGTAIAGGRPAVVLIDDVDATLGQFEDTTYTVNTRHAGAELMSLADTPTRVAGRTVRRVPVIVTGNHL